MMTEQDKDMIQHAFTAVDNYSRTSSRESHATNQSAALSYDSRNDSRQSQTSAAHSETSRVSFDPQSYTYENPNSNYCGSKTNTNGYAYKTNSLPRDTTCIHHKLIKEQNKYHHIMRDKNMTGNNGSLPRRASSCVPSTRETFAPRRNSFAADLTKHAALIHRQQSMAINDEEVCSTCSSSDAENDGDGEDESGSCNEEHDDEEKEILIDFKPRLSPPSSTHAGKKKLVKTKSDGEILVEKKNIERDEPVGRVSASEEDLKTPYVKNVNLSYSNAPIKDEGICHQLSPREKVMEAFRKRSISLEDPAIETVSKPYVAVVKSAPPTPPLEDLPLPEYPSIDSLTTISNKDHSDTFHWNESQTTILTYVIYSLGVDFFYTHRIRSNFFF